jgi:hypothetical protein
LHALKKNDPKAWLRLILDSVPKEIQAHTSSSFTLVINGLGAPAIQGEVIHAALPAHEDEEE